MFADAQAQRQASRNRDALHLQSSLTDHRFDPAVDVVELIWRDVLADERDNGLGADQRVLEQLPHGGCLPDPWARTPWGAHRDRRPVTMNRPVVQQAVDPANAAVSRPEIIKRFRILPGQFEVGAELTATGKVRRDYVAKRTTEIDALHATGPSPAA